MMYSKSDVIVDETTRSHSPSAVDDQWSVTNYKMIRVIVQSSTAMGKRNDDYSFEMNSPPDEAFLQQNYLRQFAEKAWKIYVEKEMISIFGTMPKMYFVDCDGEKVLLDGVEAFMEALKDMKKTKKFVIVAEETTTKKLEKDQPYIVPSSWFVNEMRKMKCQLKKEIISEIKEPRGAIAVRGRGRCPADSRSPSPSIDRRERTEETLEQSFVDKMTKKPEEDVPLLDEKRKAIMSLMVERNFDNGTVDKGRDDPQKSNGGARPKVIKGDYISRAIGGGELFGLVGDKNGSTVENGNESVNVCGTCGKRAGEPFFMCLNSDCLATVCHNCEDRHPIGHAMLRLPHQMDGGRRFAASTARMILTTMKSSKQLRKKHEKKKSKHEEKHAKKIAKESARSVKHNGKRAADVVLIDSVVDEAGVATVSWMLINTGKKPWDENSKIIFLACSESDSKPINKWEIPAPLLKPGEDAIVNVKLTTPKRVGEYKTFWMLAHRGEKLADLYATIDVPPVDEELKEIPPIQPNVNVEHSYAVAQKQEYEEPSPVSETFERIDDYLLESSDMVDEEGSLISGVTACKSTVMDQDYDLIPGNCDIAAEVESIDDEKDEQDSSYISIASPVIVEDSPDSTNDLTEMWQRLSLSLSSLAAFNNSDAETCRLFDVEEVETESQQQVKQEAVRSADVSIHSSMAASTVSKDNSDDASIILRTEPIAITGAVIVERKDEEFCDDSVTCEAATPDETADEISDTDEPAASDPLESTTAEQTGNDSTDSFKSSSTSRSSSFDAKRQNLGETVSNALTNALLATTQTLATVGATAKEIQTAAAAIVRTNFHHTHHNTKESWQPPKAWVPKGTQTAWTPAENGAAAQGAEDTETGFSPMARQLTLLTEMGFSDLEKNVRLLHENHGNMDRVILILLDEKARENAGM